MELGVSVTSNFQQLGTYSRTIRLVTGKADGSKYVTKDIVVRMKQLDGFRATNYNATLSGLWGVTPGKIDFEVRSLGQAWEVSSEFEGITLSTGQGAGLKTVSVSYDYLKTPVTTKSADVVFTAADGTRIVKTVNFDLYGPRFTAGYTEISFPNQQYGVAPAPVEIDLGVNQNLPLKWTATLPDWLFAKNVTGITGKDKLQVYIDPAKFPSEDVNLSGTIRVEASYLGGTDQRDITVKFPFQRTRMQASRAAFAFSDYGTQQAHFGEFWINTPTDSNTQVVSNASWLKIDSLVDGNVKFHVETAGLPQGFQTAEISLSQAHNNTFIPAKVYVGYYNSSAPLHYGATSIWGYEAYAVQDKLGPWVYIAKGNEDDYSSIAKYNLATNSLEKTLSIKGFRTINSMTVSDDGQYLFGITYDHDAFGRMVIVNLKDFSTYSVVPMQVSSTDILSYFTVDGKNMVIASSLFDAMTGERISHSGYVSAELSSQSGEYSIAGDSDTLGHLHYDYDYLTGEFSRSEYNGQVNLEGYKILSQSSSGSHLGVLHRDWSVIGSRVVSVYKIDRGALNKPVLTLLHSGKVVDEAYEGSPPQIVIGDDGRFALYSVSFGGANRLEIYRADQTLVKTYANQAGGLNERKGKSWFYTADNKALVYFQGQIASDQTLYLHPAE